MKLRLHLFFAVVSLSLAGLLVSAAKENSHGQAISRALPVNLIHAHNQVNKSLAGQFLAGGSGRQAHTDKRHGKSLISEAILVDYSVPAPRFSYWSRLYSFFLPGGCCRRPISDFCLRGPPFCC